jgi:hypothetical protein
VNPLALLAGRVDLNIRRWLSLSRTMVQFAPKYSYIYSRKKGAMESTPCTLFLRHLFLCYNEITYYKKRWVSVKINKVNISTALNTFKELEKASNTIIIKSMIRYGTVIEQE